MYIAEEITNVRVFHGIQCLQCQLKLTTNFPALKIIIDFFLSFIIRSVIKRAIISPICLKSFDYKPNQDIAVFQKKSCLLSDLKL